MRNRLVKLPPPTDANPNPSPRDTPHSRANRFVGQASDFTIITPLCLSCKWFAFSPVSSPTCLVFPKGIPSPILVNQFDHHNPYPGDNGIQYLPATEVTTKP